MPRLPSMPAKMMYVLLLPRDVAKFRGGQPYELKTVCIKNRMYLKPQCTHLVKTSMFYDMRFAANFNPVKTSKSRTFGFVDRKTFLK